METNTDRGREMQINGSVSLLGTEITAKIVWEVPDGPLTGDGYKVVGVEAELYSDDPCPWIGVTVRRATKGGALDRRSEERFTWYTWTSEEEVAAVISAAGITIPSTVQEAIPLVLTRVRDNLVKTGGTPAEARP